MKYKNIKTGEIYSVISTDVINATNKNDGIRMVLYERIEKDDDSLTIIKFVREYNEFLEKFKRII